MTLGSPKSNKTSLSPFLLPKGACEAGKHEKSGSKKVHQMMPRASNNALGKIYTSLYSTFRLDQALFFGDGRLSQVEPTEGRWIWTLFLPPVG